MVHNIYIEMTMGSFTWWPLQIWKISNKVVFMAVAFLECHILLIFIAQLFWTLVYLSYLEFWIASNSILIGIVIWQQQWKEICVYIKEVIVILARAWNQCYLIFLLEYHRLLVTRICPHAHILWDKNMWLVTAIYKFCICCIWHRNLLSSKLP